MVVVVVVNWPEESRDIAAAAGLESAENNDTMIMQQISPLPQKGESLAGLKRTSNVYQCIWTLGKALRGLWFGFLCCFYFKTGYFMRQLWHFWQLDQVGLEGGGRTHRLHSPLGSLKAPQQQPIGSGRVEETPKNLAISDMG